MKEHQNKMNICSEGLLYTFPSLNLYMFFNSAKSNIYLLFIAGEPFGGMGGGGGGFGGQQNWDFKSNIDPEELFRTIFGNKAGVYIIK